MVLVVLDNHHCLGDLVDREALENDHTVGLANLVVLVALLVVCRPSQS